MAAAPYEAAELVLDEEMVARICAGDRAAFEVLYGRYFPRVYAFVGRRLANRADVERPWEGLLTWRGLRSFGATASSRPGCSAARRTVASSTEKQHPVVPLGDASRRTRSVLVAVLRREPAQALRCEEPRAPRAASRAERSSAALALPPRHHDQDIAVPLEARTP
jgi:hypothetical protein